MKKLVFYIAPLVVALLLGSCGKTYVANPVSNAIYSRNPLNPLDSAAFNMFSDSVKAVSCYINGVFFTLDSTKAVYGYNGTDGTNYVIGTVGSYGVRLEMQQAWANNVIPFDTIHAGYKVKGYWFDTVGVHKAYASFLGNVGQVQIIRNDASRFVGRFYFQALDTVTGYVINVTNGYFNLHK